MKKAIKWIAIIGIAVIVLIIAALLIVPMFIEVQKYKPEIEKQVTKATGRPFTIGGELRLSLFPWAGLALSDLHLGNPPGFEEKDLLSVKFFDVRLKLVPLLSKEIEVQRFVIDRPMVFLEKNKAGRGNWEGIGVSSEASRSKPSAEKTKAKKGETEAGLPFKNLMVGEFVITDGAISYLDHTSGARREISSMSLRLTDVSLEQPIRLVVSALMDGKPLSLEGQLGPIGPELSKGKIPLDFSLKALKELDIRLKGNVSDPMKSQQFDLTFQISPFSPRKLMTAAGQPFPVAAADPQALSRVALKGSVKGDPQAISISDGALEFDESKMNFSMKAKQFSKPDIAFDLKLDKINLDRYLPPPSKEKAVSESKKAEPRKTDYAPLRRLVVEGTIQIVSLTVKNAKVQDLNMKVTGKNGLIQLDPVTAKLYQGTLSNKGSLDATQDILKTNVNLQLKGVQAGPMVKDLLEKDIIEGVAEADAVISLVGDEPAKIKRSLTGKGQLLFKDGAIKGIDLGGMVRNAKAAFGLAKEGERPRTDFSELSAPYTITDGIVNTTQTTIVSPLFRVLAAGKANLVDETLDFRVEPKFVSTLRGQGDAKERSGITVPVIVSGTFSNPTFQPDLKGMLEKGLTEGLLPSMQKRSKTETKGQDTQPQSPTEALKGVLKGLKPSQ